MIAVFLTNVKQYLLLTGSSNPIYSLAPVLLVLRILAVRDHSVRWASSAGSDVGPFPHGTQAREFELMVKYGMSPLAVLQADLINGAKLLGWEGQIGALKTGYF